MGERSLSDHLPNPAGFLLNTGERYFSGNSYRKSGKMNYQGEWDLL